MNQTGIPFPNISPVIIELGPFALHWYGLAYILGLVGGWLYLIRLVQLPIWPHKAIGRETCDDLLLWGTLGVIVGGRLGYVLFYNWGFFRHHLMEIFAIWHGGMSFHGGLLGVILVLILFARYQKLSPLALSDAVAVVTPIGLFFGRLANFINAELWGRITTAPWGVIFPGAGPLPRHPSQLYEAALEGLLLFLVLNYLAYARQGFSYTGRLTGVFLLGYGVLRLLGEQFRQPDAHIGFLWGGTTLGVWLTLPMLLLGGWLIWRSRTQTS